MLSIEREIEKQRVQLKSLKQDITPNDKTNVSRLARNAIHRAELKIVDLEVEYKTLKKEAYSF